MALLPPVPGAVLTQGFGPSRLLAEPAMFASSTIAYWQPFTGGRFYSHFHPAQDLAAPLGTPILASEAGVIDFAGIVYVNGKPNGGGLVVRLKIRDNVWVEHSHCSSIVQPVGKSVARGERIAGVGATGNATGNHDHWSVLMRQVNEGVARTFMYDPKQFLPGGARADDDRIKPVTTVRYMSLNGPGINIRSTPDLDVGTANLYATSTTTGIYRLGIRIAPLTARMRFSQWVTTDDGTFARLTLNAVTVFVKKELVHFV